MFAIIISYRFHGSEVKHFVQKRNQSGPFLTKADAIKLRDQRRRGFEGRSAYTEVSVEAVELTVVD